MDNFNKWFDENSGYALHRPAIKKLSGCCADSVGSTGRFVWLPLSGGAAGKCPLLVCARCGRSYAACQEGFVEIDNLLKYRVTNV